MKTFNPQARSKMLALALVVLMRPNCAGFDSESPLRADSSARRSAVRSAARPVKIDIGSANIASPIRDLEGIDPVPLIPISVPADEGLKITLEQEGFSFPHGPKSGFRGRLSRTLERVRTQIRDVSLSAIYDSSDNKENGKELPGAFASGIIHGRLKPLKLRRGVEKAAHGLRLPKDDNLSRRYFHSHNTLTDASTVLDADPEDPAAIERAIRALFESQPEKFGLSDGRGKPALTNDHLALVHITPVKGGSGRADSVYAVFRQVQKGKDEDGRPYYLPVYGASLNLTFKIMDNRLVVKGYDARLYPVQVPMTPRFSNDILHRTAAQRLMPATISGRVIEKFRSLILKPLRMAAKFEDQPPVFLNREIIPDDKGNWHTANIYQGMDLNGQPVNIGVNIHTGEAFAWDAHGLSLRPKRPSPDAPGRPATVRVVETAAEPSSSVSLTVKGRGNTPDHGNDHGPIDGMPLPHLKIRDSRGNLLGVTDENGRLNLAIGQTLEVTADLNGKYASVADANRNNKPLKITLKLAPGEAHRATINPTSDSDELVGQINSYLGWTLLLQWMKSLGVDDKRLDAPLAINNNKTDLPCNAYYDPLSDTLNLQSASEDCENTAQPSILLHESGHRFVQMFARISESHLQNLQTWAGIPREALAFLRQSLSFIMGSGVNEGTADTISMYFRDNPKVGERFFKHPGPGTPTIVRDGRNIRLYEPGEAHDEGETLMGATWEIYEGIKQILGEKEGAVYAASLVIPTLIFSQPRDVPTALAQILLAALHKDGKSPFANIVLRAAERRNIPLPGFAKPANDNKSQRGALAA